jgi:hypothetical protein
MFSGILFGLRTGLCCFVPRSRQTKPGAPSSAVQKGGVFCKSRGKHFKSILWLRADSWSSFYKASHSAEGRGMGHPVRRFSIVARSGRGLVLGAGEDGAGIALQC